MAHLIEVAFKGNRKEFFLWEHDDPPAVQAAVIVDADRGEDLGRVHAVGELAAKRSAGTAHGIAAGPPSRRALRLATLDEEARGAELRDQNEVARRRAAERVKANGLVMKITDAEWQWDRKKLTFYFTAEKRVDFRTLVRELAAMFRTRIELKQIGVRDEAKRLDGIGRCGRQYCSASWLPELRPVNLGVAKDQRLSLNPQQISGACGRLMCCLRYEHEFYVQSRKRFPKEGKIVVTTRGEEKVVANDIFTDRVTLRGVDGETRVVPLAELRRELAGGSDVSDTPDAPDALAPVGLPEERPRAPRALTVLAEAPRAAEPDRTPPAAGSPATVASPAAPSRASGRVGNGASRTAGVPGTGAPLTPVPAAADAEPAPGGAAGSQGAVAGVGAPAPASDGEGAAERRARRRRGRRGGRRRGGDGGDSGAAGDRSDRGSGPDPADQADGGDGGDGGDRTDDAGLPED